MLGKTAGGLYWMFRYLERSENIARLVEAGLRMALTRPDSAAYEWNSVVDTAGVRDAYLKDHDAFEASGVVDFLLRDTDNPSSVLSCVQAARTNARVVRTALTREVWEATNECWLFLRDVLKDPIPERDLPDTLSLIRKQSALVRGALHGTMLRNEMYDFARIGTFLERADNTARILDVKYYVLLPSFGTIGSPIDNVQWEMILRSVSSHRAYRMVNGTDINPRGIANFLILDQRMPRSLSFCYRKIADNLDYLATDYGERLAAHDLMAQGIANLAGVSIDQIFDFGLHEFLVNFKATNNALGVQIEKDYRFQG